MSALYRWHITVRRLDTYGDRVVKETPATILAADRNEVTSKVRLAFNAAYDDFRGFWSHDWMMRSVDEVHGPIDTEAAS